MTKMQDWDALLLSLQQDSATAREQAEAAIELSREYHLGQWEPMGMIFHGWAIAEQGDIQAGLEELQAGVSAMRATNFQALYTYFLALQSDLYAKMGHIEEGISMLNQALNFTSSSEERWYEAELHRRGGELQLQCGDEVEAENAWARALEIAQSQQVKTFALHAAVDLARLWHRQGHADKAREVLAPIYYWFTEGFDTPDLIEAKKVLGRLDL